jgi:Tol biopolymer transport system component
LLVTGPVAAGDLWNYDLSGRPPIPLSLPGDNRFPVWSPDGQQVAFARREGSPFAVYSLPADGSVLTPEPLTTTTTNSRVPKAWSTAGELIILYGRTANNVDIEALNPTGSSESRPIVATDFNEGDAALSPNGSWLAYVSNRTGRAEIWVQGYPDGVAIPVSTNGGYEPRWSADGRELFYLQGNAMMAVAVETEREFSFAPAQQLFAGSYLQERSPLVASYDVAPDGRFLMIQLAPGTGEDAASIVVVENWTEELKQRVRPRGQ